MPTQTMLAVVSEPHVDLYIQALEQRFADVTIVMRMDCHEAHQPVGKQDVDVQLLPSSVSVCCDP